MRKRPDLGKDVKTGRFLPGNQAALKHGLRSEGGGLLPLKARRYVEAMNAQLIADLGGEERLTAARRILVDKTVALVQVTLAIEAFIRDAGAFSGRKLQHVLSDDYPRYVNLIRQNLVALGLSKQALDPDGDVLGYIKALDAAKGAQNCQSISQDDEEIAPQIASQSDFQGQEGQNGE
jgi:hypothetical protein